MTTELSVFTKIINRELPATILFENERIIVIEDINKDAPVHLLGITKEPFLNLHDLVTHKPEQKELLWELMTVLADLAVKLGIDKTGYRLVTNSGADAHQIVHHLHIHMLGGEKLYPNTAPKPE